jgi:hypothetical protein
MGEPTSPGKQTVGPIRAFDAYGTASWLDDPIVRVKQTLTKVIVLRFPLPIKQRSRNNLLPVRHPVGKHETGCAPDANPSAEPSV